MNISISKQQLACLPAAHYAGSIRIIDNPDDVAGAVAELYQADLIGFDTETRPSFKKGQTFKVALMQLATIDTCYLFRLNKIGVPESLVNLLQDESKTKIGLSIRDDFRNLNKICKVSPVGFVELQNYVTQWNIADKSLSKLYGILFGKRLSKTQRLTNWDADTLTEAQTHYAALDAFACIQIFTCLRDGKFHPEVSPYQVEDVSYEKV
ncbi:MAG: 3'-5' exonuclease domain-containing protein 2 [Muribaculum sp.]|nr:3'-5' exonuclease domain-containing protein 2 [Muribaculum sp.]